MSADWQTFWTSWQFDAWLTLALVLTGLVYLRGWLRLRQRGARRFDGWRLAAFILAMTTVGMALQSPVEPFSSLLLQMHMLQHVLLMFVAPPLLWLADPELPLLIGLPKFFRRRLAAPLLRDPLVRWVTGLLAHPAVALGLFVIAGWTWHLPAFYQLALASQTWHQVEHASFFLAALVFWRVVIAPYPSPATMSRWVMLPYLLVAGLQGTVFSGLLTFSDRLFYSHYATVPRLWNITPLDDQAIAGALMWLCGSIAYLLALAWVATELWNDSPQPQAAGGHPPRQAHPQSNTLDHGRRQQTAARIARLRAQKRKRPQPVREVWDLLNAPLVGTLLKSNTFRPTLQIVMFLLAALIVIDGLWGPQATSLNLAGVAPWIHWRGLLVIGLLVAGNIFCMACPFTLPRTLAKRLFRTKWNWPNWLRNKWLAVGLLIVFFWAYEAFALWDTPWWTAWIVIGYFVASFAVDGLFRGAAFCKYVCPIGQFNFVQSLCSPLQVAVRDANVCHTCDTKDCIRGGTQGNGCNMELFQPQKTGNLDCTFCLDCVQACPRENVGMLAFVGSSQLTGGALSAQTGRWYRRTDVAALLMILASAAFVNAAWMVEPVVRLEEQVRAELPSISRPMFVAIGMILSLAVIPAGIILAVAAVSRWWSNSQRGVVETATRFAIVLVPLALGMWTAHYTFHLFTSAGTLWAAGTRVLSDYHLATFGDFALACACCGDVASWILPLEIVCLDIGLCGSLYVAYRIACPGHNLSWAVVKAWTPWAVLSVTLFAAGIWIFFQPMQMRGTMVLGG